MNVTKHKTEKVAPIGIRHFMLWILCTAIALAFNRVLRSGEKHLLLDQLNLMAYCILYGVALSGVVIFVWRLVRGQSTGLEHPGHWLLMLAGYGAVIDGLVAVGIKIHFQYFYQKGMVIGDYVFTETEYWEWLFHQMICYTIAAVICTVMLVRMRQPRHWRIVFGLLIVDFVCQVMAYWLLLLPWFNLIGFGWIPWTLPHHSMLVTSLMSTSAATIAILVDRNLGLKRDWLHWCGLAVCVLQASLEWIRYVRWVVLDV